MRLKSVDTESGVIRCWSTVGTRNLEFRGDFETVDKSAGAEPP